MLDHDDRDAELAGNLPIRVDLTTAECRFLDVAEFVDLMRRGRFG
ncbi:hypothetical protein ABZS66_47040 [Dactylosporangium sp. NPDC005572]